MEEFCSQATAFRNQYTQTTADELSTVRAQLSDLEEKQRSLRDAVNRQAIVAPIAGQVVDLRVFTLGGVVRSSSTTWETGTFSIPSGTLGYQ